MGHSESLKSLWATMRPCPKRTKAQANQQAQQQQRTMTDWWYMEKSLRPDRLSIHDIQAFGTVISLLLRDTDTQTNRGNV